MTRRMLKDFGTQKLIANLGHGMHPDHNPAHLQVFLEAVHEYSTEMNQEQARKKQKYALQAQSST